MPADLRFAPLQSHELLPGRKEFVAPQPLRTTLVALMPALVLTALWAIGAAPAAVAAAGGGVLFGLAGIRGAYAWFDACRCRALADRLLRRQPGAAVSSPLTDWRAPQLTSERTRRLLVKRVQHLIRDAELDLRAGSSPLDRHTIEQSLFLLRRLDRRLGDLSRPVSPYGVLVVGELPKVAELPDALTEALAALDTPR
ncbi:MAG TPA: hypothetical protein VMS63_05465 [Gaiellaceae bacterium]|nr:hypothetical protein [Gaiellaceae bacterium]